MPYYLDDTYFDHESDASELIRKVKPGSDMVEFDSFREAKIAVIDLAQGRIDAYQEIIDTLGDIRANMLELEE